MPDKLRAAMIGCGTITRQRHAREYALNENVEIAGFFDLREERALALQRQFGGKVYANSEELLADESVDIVSVCNANAFHAESTVAALERGKHVLCEKPMAVTLEQCEAMLAASVRANRRLLIDQNQRLTPAHLRAKKILDSGELGRVITFRSAFGHAGPESWSADQSANTWFFKKELAAFGSLADLGIHKIDLMRYLAGGSVTSVYAELATLDKKFEDGAPIEVDDNAFVLLRFDSGAMGTITTSWTYYGEECNATTLYCSGGIMRLYEDPVYSLEITWKSGMKAHFEVDRIQTNTDLQQASSGVIDQFVNAVRTGEPSVLDASDIVESMRTVYACIESAAKGAPVKL